MSKKNSGQKDPRIPMSFNLPQMKRDAASTLGLVDKEMAEEAKEGMS